MKIDIFELAKDKIDPGKLVAQIDTDLREVRILNPVRGRIVQELFENDFSAFTARPDAVTPFQAWSPEAIQQILQEELYSFSLGGRILHS